MSDLLVLQIREIRKRIQQIPRVIARRDTNGILLSRRIGAGIDNVRDNHDHHAEAETRQADDDARGVLWRLLRGKRLGREDVRDAVRSKEQSAGYGLLGVACDVAGEERIEDTSGDGDDGDDEDGEEMHSLRAGFDRDAGEDRA